MSTYEDAGFNNFLVRSIDSPNVSTLSGLPNIQNREFNYDSGQPTGSLGGTLQLGLVSIRGTDGVIEVQDTNGDTAIRVGDPNDPGQLLVPKGAAYIYDRDKNPTIVNGRIVGNKILAKVKFESAISVQNDASLGFLYIAPFPGSDLYFTVPDGVTTIKITCSTGMDIYDRPITSTTSSYNTDTAAALFNGGSSFFGIFTEVKPGDQKHFFLTVVVSDTGVPTNYAFTKQSPGLFMIEMG